MYKIDKLLNKKKKTKKILYVESFKERVSTFKAKELKKKGYVGIVTKTRGLDHVEQKILPVQGLPAYCGVDVAEFAIMQLLVLARKMPIGKSAYEKDNWEQGSNLVGKNVLVIGDLGDIGSKVKHRLQGFEVKIVGHDIARIGDDEEALLKKISEADVIFICAYKKYFLVKEHFDKMKKGVLLINPVGRNNVIGGSCFSVAFNNNVVAGYAVDDINIRFTDTPRIFMTPHVGAWTSEAQRKKEKEWKKLLKSNIEP